MSLSDFESDTDFLSLDGVQLANDPEGHLLVNVEKADEFDPRIANDVEGLLFLGKLTHDCAIYGHTFTLKTLTRGERLAMTLFARDYDDTLAIAQALESATLALSIVMVDNRPLSIPLDSDDRNPEAVLRRNFPIVSKWFDPVLDALYLEYQSLNIRMRDAFLELEGKSTASRRTTSP